MNNVSKKSLVIVGKNFFSVVPDQRYGMTNPSRHVVTRENSMLDSTFTPSPRIRNHKLFNIHKQADGS